MRGTHRRTVTRAGRAGALAVAALAAGACASGSFDRDSAVESVLSRYGGRLTRSQAECYVDRVADELGAAVLERNDPSPEQVPRLTRIRTDCAGVASLGTSLPPVSRRDPTGTAPLRRGQSPRLDVLWDQCAAGSGPACDHLFDEAPLDSEYEEFALTCGGRTSELRCADRYPG